MSLSRLVLFVIAIWLGFAILGGLFHLLRLVIWLAILGTLALVVYTALQRRR